LFFKNKFFANTKHGIYIGEIIPATITQLQHESKGDSHLQDDCHLSRHPPSDFH
jgi:hypothetical protein